MDSTLVPWFAPKASPALASIVRNLGHKTPHGKGDVLYESGSLFSRVVFVNSGVVARSVLVPGFEDSPFFISLALPGSLVGCVDTLYVKDQVHRKQWAVTSCDTLTVQKEIFLQLADHEPTWRSALESYNARMMLAVRLGMLVTRAGTMEQRVAAFIYSFCRRSDPLFDEMLLDQEKEWIPIPALPPKKLIAQIITSDIQLLEEVENKWLGSGVMTRVKRAVFLKKEILISNREWLSRFLGAFGS